jgi:tetratricopeptide (TPR) repeat protein
MADTTEAPEGESSFAEHALYQAALDQMASGEIDVAIVSLRELAELFPEEKTVQDMLVRAQLRSTFATAEYVTVRRSQPGPILRRMVLILMLVGLCLAGAFAFSVAYEEYVANIIEDREQERQVESLLQQGEALLAAGDLAGARLAFEQYLILFPDNVSAQAAIALIDKQEALDRLYVDAIAALDGGDLDTALDLFSQIQAQNAQYRDVENLIQSIQARKSLEARWQEAEGLIEAGDWTAAITALSQIRATEPQFRRAQLEEYLFQACDQAARLLIAQANGDLDQLRTALEYLGLALGLRPTSRDLVDLNYLATKFVDGVDALAREEWTRAVGLLEPVYAVQPDFQGGVLLDYLREAYPRAASQLVSRASGAVRPLEDAIEYLDKALALQPGDQYLLRERHLAVEYVAGAAAFSDADWDAAIAHWGPIYSLQPDYQGGALKDNLERACDSSEEPDVTHCPP